MLCYQITTKFIYFIICSFNTSAVMVCIAESIALKPDVWQVMKLAELRATVFAFKLEFHYNFI